MNMSMTSFTDEETGEVLRLAQPQAKTSRNLIEVKEITESTKVLDIKDVGEQESHPFSKKRIIMEKDLTMQNPMYSTIDEYYYHEAI